MTKEREEALEKLAILCKEEIYIGSYDDSNGPYRYNCCHEDDRRNHKDGCWYQKIQMVLFDLDKLS